MDLVTKAVIWITWLERNAHIFNDCATSSLVLILKIDHLLLPWFSAAFDARR